MKKMAQTLKNLVSAGLIAASAFSANGADKTPSKAQKPAKSNLEETLRQGVSSNIKLDFIDFRNGQGNKQTVLQTIPPLTDLNISTNTYQALRPNDYQRLMNTAGTNQLARSKEALIQFSDNVRPNLATIVSYTQATNETGVRYQKITGLGSGIILSSDGFVATANHVVKQPEKNQFYALSFAQDGTAQWSPLKVLATSEKRDVALGKLEGASFNDLAPVVLRQNHFLPQDALFGVGLEYASPGKAEGDVTPQSGKTRIKPFEVHPFTLEHNGKGTYVIAPSFKEAQPMLRLWSGTTEGNALPASSRQMNVLQDASKTVDGQRVEYLIPYKGKAEQGNSGSAVYDSSGAVAGLISLGSPGTDQGLLVSAHTLRELIRGYQTHKK